MPDKQNTLNQSDHDILIVVKTKLCEMHEDVKEIKKDIKRQNGRIGKLEIWRSYIIGVGAAIIIGGGLVLKYLF